MSSFAFVYFITFTLFMSVPVLGKMDMQEGILNAQCQSRCLKKYGTAVTPRKDDIYSSYRETDCKKHNCRQCMGVCDIVAKKPETDCHELCSNKTICVESCAFILREIKRNNKRKQTAHDLDLSQGAINQPEVVCMDIPYSRYNICQENVASLSLRWRTTPEMAGNHMVYVISARKTESTNDEPEDWRVLQVESSTFVRMKHLSCDTKYQFRVTPVTRFGAFGVSRVSEWITTPIEPLNLTTPTNLRVIHQSLHHQRPSAVIAWDEQNDSDCFYRVYWMYGDKRSEDEIKTPPEFKYRLDDLEFSTNYTVILHSYDREMIKGSKGGATTSFITPSCLQATNFNYNICPPEAPVNVRSKILTANAEAYDVEYVNLTLFWDPPSHTKHGEGILQYEIKWRKNPPASAAHLIVELSGILLINATEDGPPNTSVTLYDLHNHNVYIVMLRARTNTGFGKVTREIINLGLPVATQTPQALQASTGHIDHDGLTTAEILLVILIPSLVAMVFASIIWYFAWKRSNSKTFTTQRKSREEQNPIYDGISPCSDSYSGQTDTEADTYEIDFDSLTFLGVLGEGAFGKVMKAEFRRPLHNRERNEADFVAVKMLRDTFSTDELRQFRKEIEAMKSLEKHPHLVSIIGCCLSGPKICLVMDYCALGDLRNYLRKYREKLTYTTLSPYNRRTPVLSDNSDTPLVSSDSGVSRDSDDANEDRQETTEEITDAELLSYARQITMGMAFLEQRKFVHRDLAARNILLSDKRHVKISDFGLTRDVYETSMYQPTSARKLPYKWMALESLFSQEFTVKSDVWSFGIVLWEIVTLGGTPYPSIPLKDLYGLLNDGYRMERPANCSPNLYQIMLSCWHPCPVNRPYFGELKLQLEDLLAETQSYIDLTIEVSGDYFHNDSTTGSRNTNTSTIVSTDENQNRTIFNTTEHPIEQHQIEIHSVPKEFLDETSGIDESSALTSELEDDEVFVDNDSSKNFCMFNLENNLKKENSLNFDILPDKSKKCSCVLCVNRESLKSNISDSSSVPPLKHTTFLRNSLRSIIEKVGKTNKFFMPLQRKRSFSLTDMDKGLKC